MKTKQTSVEALAEEIALRASVLEQSKDELKGQPWSYLLIGEVQSLITQHTAEKDAEIERLETMCLDAVLMMPAHLQLKWMAKYPNAVTKALAETGGL